MVFKCDKCKHNPVCAMKDNMKRLVSKMEDEKKLMENKFFRINVECEHYLDEKTHMFPPGVR